MIVTYRADPGSPSEQSLSLLAGLGSYGRQHAVAGDLRRGVATRRRRHPGQPGMPQAVAFQLLVAEVGDRAQFKASGSTRTPVFITGTYQVIRTAS
jgi:hypothetical protein